MSTLSQKLLANNERAKRERELRNAEKEVAKEREVHWAHQAVARFFEDAKANFIESIENGRCENDLEVLVGRDNYDERSDDASPLHQGILKSFKAHGTTWSLAHRAPLAVTTQGPFHEYWAAFERWAASEGLHAYWYEEPLGEDGFHRQLKLRLVLSR